MRAALSLLPLAIAASPAMAREMTLAVNARLRCEGGDQASFARDADALTLGKAPTVTLQAIHHRFASDRHKLWLQFDVTP